MEKESKRAIKVYVPVRAYFRSDGTLVPTHIVWEDGREYEIDRVKALTQAPALKAGGQGDRYTVMIRGQESYLFFERNASVSGGNIGRWFVERRI